MRNAGAAGGRLIMLVVDAESIGIGRGMALSLTVLVLLAGTVATAWALWPSVSEQADQLAAELPAAPRYALVVLAHTGCDCTAAGRAGPCC